jgi:tol-pal system protein YbgF
MKKNLIKFIFFSTLLLNGCATASQNDIQTLKIRVINLETILQQQMQKNQELEKRVTQLEKKVSEGMADKLIDLRAQIMKEVEDLRDQLTILSAKIEDLQFKYEEIDTEYSNSLKEILNQLRALSLKVAFLEKKLGILTPLPQEGNATSSFNATLSMPSTPQGLNTTASFNNQTISQPANELANQTANQTGSQTPQSPINATSNATGTLSFSNQTASNQYLNNQTSQNETNILNEKLLKLKESSLYQEGYNLFAKKDYAGALKAFQEYVKLFPKGKWIGQAYFWIGECYFNQGDYEDAILSYQKLIELPGWHPQKPLAIFRQAQAFKALGDEEAYKILLKKLIRQYPYTKEAAEARKLLNL